MSEAPEPTSPPAAATDIANETENVIESYQIIAEWIRFADAKAAAVLTVNGALASVLIPTLKPYLAAEHARAYEVAAMIAFGVWLVATAASCTFAFRCILPLRVGGRHPAEDECRHFHPAAISSHYQLGRVRDFQRDFEAMGTTGFKQQVLAGMVIDSHISSVKYGHVTRSIQVLALGAVVGFTYLVLVQF